MEKGLAALGDQLISTSDLNLSEFGIRALLLYDKKTYDLEQLEKKKYKNHKFKNFLWRFNDKSLGDYCRSLNSLINHILKEVTVVNKTNACSLEDYGEFIASLINAATNALDSEEATKQKIQNTSVILNIISPFSNNGIQSLLVDSIDNLFSFRHMELMKLKTELNRIGDNLKYYYSRFMGFVLSRTFNEEDKPLGTFGFCWNKNRNIIEDLVKFHTFLRELGFIERDTSINLLKAGFDGRFLSDPLNIKWTKLVKGKSSKALLFYFIDELEHLNYIYITEQNSMLFDKIDYVFCDNKGEKFKNLDVSKSQWLNQRKTSMTPQEIQLDSIMHSISRG
jgi:hypothetical protein